MSTSAANHLKNLLPWLIGLTVAALLAAVFGLPLLHRKERLDLDASGRLVVLPIVDVTGERELAWTRLGMMEMAAEALMQNPGLQVVSPRRLPRLVETRGLNADDDPDVRRRVRELGLSLGADLALDALLRRRFERRGAEDETPYALEITIYDGEDRPRGRLELRGGDPARLAEGLVREVAEALTTRLEPVRLTRVFSTSPFLNRLYGMGLAELRRSGPAAQRLPAAQRFFDVALEIQPTFLAAQARRVECTRRQGDLDAARRLAVALLQEAQNRGERHWEIESLHELSRIEALDDDLGRAEERARQARTLAADAGNRAVELALLHDLARFALAADMRGRATELLSQIFQLEDQLGDRVGRVDTLVQLGSLALATDDLEGAEARFSLARKEAAALGDVWNEMTAEAQLGEVLYRQGRHGEAVELWNRALAFYEERGDSARRLILKRNIAEALLIEQDWEGAEDAFLDLLEIAQKRQNPRLEALASLRLAFILLRRGYPYQAKPHLDRALELDRRIDEPLTLQRLIAWMAYEQGNYRLAVDVLSTVERQAGDEWRETDAAFLEVFRQALERGERLPLPGETDVLGPGP